MAEKTTSQSQQSHSSKNPGAEAASMFDKMAEENIQRMESFYQEWSKLQDKGVEQTQQMIDEAAKLVKESVTYTAKMTAEWQKLALATSRQATQMMTGPWM